MNTSFQKLDLMHTPMRGRHLIEASAGTGKTYTLTGLVLRQLLGHGAPCALPIEQILVVTFTKAATEELKDRIRRKIQQAYQGFIGCQVDDPMLQTLIDDTPKEQRPAAILQLDLALRTMDEAAIFTIHSFCHKLLSELAFESGQLFEFDYELDDTTLKQEAAKDVWRRMCYPLSPAVAQIIYQHFKTPSALCHYLNPVLYKPLKITPCQPSLAQVTSNYQEHLTAFQQTWSQEQAACFTRVLYLDLNGTSYGAKKEGHDKLRKKWARLTSLCQEGQYIDTSEYAHLFYSKLKLNKKGAHLKPEPEMLPALVALETLHEACYASQIISAFVQEAKQALEAQLKLLKLQKNCLSSDDLLIELHQALQHPEQAQVLQQKIAHLYPVALIDEFQDTDPIQYAIFSAIYPPAQTDLAEQEPQGFYMIGDPKQAIYAFRGADIFTYIQAKHQVHSHFNLTTNYRSSPSMIHGVNAFFKHQSQPFIYDQAIPFHPVDAPDDEALPALQLPESGAMNYRVLDQIASSNSRAQHLVASDCANRIATLLQGGQEGTALLKGRSVEAKDIAILVRTSHQAEIIKNALRERQINSVFLSRDCVFHTELAHDLKYIMQAMMHPRQETYLRSALATRTLGFTLKEIEAFNQKEDQRLFWLEKFFNYQQTWRKNNWLTAFMDLLQDCQVTLKMLAQDQEGMRHLTNLRHLSDIIQEQSQKLSGQTALLHWYQQQLYSKDTTEEQQLRLESEHDLIQITTIHKSKGLEYNLCFLPFVSLDELKLKSSQASVHHDPQTHEATWNAQPDNFKSNDTVAELLLKESLAESIRLLYVAVTRAKYFCEISIIQSYRYKSSKKSALHDNALGYLLGFHGQKELSMADIYQSLQQRYQDQPDATRVHWVDTDPLPLICFQTTSTDEPSELRANTMTRKMSRSWRLSSYSALTYHMQTEKHLPQVPQNTGVVEENIRFQFFKGAAAGNFLHELFEHIDFRQTDPEVLKPTIQAALQKHQIDDHLQEPLSCWVADVLKTQLQPNLSLSDLSPQQISVEMEFHLPVDLMTAPKINQLLEHFGYQSDPSLSFDDLQGMLKGFIDLWFEHEGGYYIADYKSNYLGGQASDYHQSALQEAIKSHRYDLQYLIYTVAIHRYLKQKVSSYQYETHFGGCFYLFLRGMFPDQNSGIFFDRPDQDLIHALDACFSSGAF